MGRNLPPELNTKSAAGFLTGNGALWTVAAQVGVIYMLSTIPTPLYSTYQREFRFSNVTLTLIFAAYVVGTVLAMFFLGRISDQIGRKPVVLAALALGVADTFVFLFVHGTAWLFFARALSGLAIALSAGASAAWLLELQPNQDKVAATGVAIAANLAGLSVGAILSGLLAQWAPSPLRMTYMVYLGILLGTTAAIGMTRESGGGSRSLREISLWPRLGVPREIRVPFIAPAVAAFATLSVIGFYAGLIPSLLSRVVHVQSPAVSALVVGGLFLVGAVAAASTARIDARVGLMASLTLLLPAIGLLVWAETVRSMTMLLIGTFVSGLATGPAYLFGLRVVNELAPEDRRAEVVSSYLISCYAGNSLPVIGVGVLAKATSPQTADVVFAGVVALLVAAALAVEVRSE